MKLISIFIILTGSVELPVTPNWRIERAHSTRFQRKKMDVAIERYDMMSNHFNREKGKTTLLQWWNFDVPFLERLPTKCGGCWTTNNRQQEFSADGILFDNTRYKAAKSRKDNGF